MSLNELTIIQAAKGLKNREFSSTELTQAVFDQIKKIDGQINAFLSFNEEEALKQAKTIDEARLKNKELNLLAGIPVAIKDVILVKGLKCTAGSKILENYVSPYDATVIEKLKSAGAVIIGKTNLDEFAMGSSTENSAFKITKNPHNLACVAGGSSGGSAAAVAANETIYALGSDTGGSIRQPASFCGVVGFKPTYGAVSRFGLIAMASSLDQIGPLTKTVEDCMLVFDAIKGKDMLDSTSVELNQRPEIRNQKPEIKNLRVGMPKEYFAEGIDPGVEELVKQAIKRLANMGAKVEEISLPHTEYALACYYLIMPSEVSANLARYDGIKYGASAAQGGLLDVYLKTRGQYFGTEPRRRIMLGTYALSAGYYEAYYLKAQKVRTLIKRDFEEVFNPSAKGVDVIITPTSPTPAFKIGEKVDDPIKMYLSDIYTVPINLAGLPAISLPCGRLNNLPVGLQIIGPQFGEEIVFQTALACENLLKI
jgi:aspartyl-tRNA(Asn)/glutamyl-tRNA(Gln) amidotransferase subunit A